MKMTMRIVLGTALCFMFSYLSAAIGKLGSFEAVAARYSKGNPDMVHVEIERKFPANEVQEIEIETVSSDINFVLTDSDSLKISVAGDFPISLSDKDKVLESKVDSGKLTLTMDHQTSDTNFPGLHFDMKQEGKLTLSLPKNLKKILVKTVSGDVKLNNFDVDIMELDSVSGDVKGEKSHVENLKLKTTSGDLKWDGDIAQLESESISGDVELKLSNTSPKIEARTVSGDVKIGFDKTPDVQYRLSTTSGEIRVASDFQKNQKDEDHLSGVLGSGKGSVSAETISGDLKFMKQ
jgi:DUF4097 and DUF4098 domain-containing protein YvlB